MTFCATGVQHWHFDVSCYDEKNRKILYFYFNFFSLWSPLKHCQYKCISFFTAKDVCVFFSIVVNSSKILCARCCAKTFNFLPPPSVIDSQVVETRMIASLRTYSSQY